MNERKKKILHFLIDILTDSFVILIFTLNINVVCNSNLELLTILCAICYWYQSSMRFAYPIFIAV
jgi:hypothetical protein